MERRNIKWKFGKILAGYEGLYQVSNLGNVLSLNYLGHGKKQLLKQTMTANGYKKVILWKNGIGKNYRVNRLVAEAFIDNPDNLPYVNHKDWNRLNNRADNLEWCTPKYNSNHKRNNRKPLGE